MKELTQLEQAALGFITPEMEKVVFMRVNP